MIRWALIAMLAIASGALALGSADAPTHAAYPGDNGDIAYGGAGGIFSVDENREREPALLISGASSPSWSADGQKLIYERDDGIYSSRADGTGERQILIQGFAEDYYDPAWSPDGRGFAVVHLRGGDPHSELLLANADSTNPRVLMNVWPDFLFRPRWSPDGSKILVGIADDLTEDRGLVLVDTTTGAQQRFTPTGVDALYGDWSPDGTQIVFSAANENENNIYIFGANGGPGRLLGPGERPAWSPDGRRIVFHQTLPDSSEVRTMDLNGGDVRAVAQGRSADWAPQTLLSGVEFTQAIQQLQTISQLQSDLEDDGEPPVPMIAEKPAAMRVYFGNVPIQSQFIVEVSGIINEEKQVTVDPTCTAELRRKQKEGCWSVDFYFTPPSGEWTVTLKVRDFTLEVVEEHDFTLRSVTAQPIILDAVRVCHERDPLIQDAWFCGIPDEFLGTLEYMQKLMPAPNVYLLQTGGAVYHELPQSTADEDAIRWWATVSVLLTNFRNQRGQAEMAGVHLTAGAVTAGAPLFDGFALRDSRVLSAKTVPLVVAHEGGHALGVRHTNTELPLSTGLPPGCLGLAVDNETDWVHEDNFLHSETPNEAIEVGFDVAGQLALPGDEWLELMGYCEPSWISPRTYTQILTRLSSFTLPATMPSGADGPQWLVSGEIDGGVTFGPLVEIDGVATSDNGDHTIEVLDATDGVLAQKSFAPLTSDGSEGEAAPYFSELVPVVAGAAAIRVLDASDTEIGRITFGGSAPEVSVAAATGADGIAVSWTIDDPDGGDHTALLYYSTDGGTTWEAIGAIDGNSVVLDPTMLAGSSQAAVRVLVSDGVNTGSGESAIFAVPEKAPSAEIIGPTRNSFRAATVVALQAAATDAEDGVLAGNAIAWSSSKDGALGTGAILPVYDLSTGTHTITMTARDSDNNTVTDTINVSVSDRPLVEGEEPGVDHIWGDNDCNGAITTRDNQALLRNILQQPALSQTQPCPALGDVVSMGGASVLWGDLDCNGAIGARDGQALLRNVLGQPPLSQTQPCPAIGDTVAVAGVAALRRLW